MTDVVLFGNSTIDNDAIPQLSVFRRKIWRFAAPVASDRLNLGNSSDFLEVLEEFNGITDNIDAVCDAHF